MIGVKGEVLLVEQPSLKLNHTVFMTNGCYIVPKEKHRYLIGATSEFNNYSVGNSDAGISWLLKHAQQCIPELSHSHILKQWSGVRPYTEYELPIMDQIDDGLFIITGHYRNGILLSLLSVKILPIGYYQELNQQAIQHLVYQGVSKMKCIINGNLFTFEHEDSITRILESLELDPQRVVVEHNQSLIKQDDFDNQIVREDDRLELLEFVGGG